MVDLRQRFADTRNDLAVLLWRNGLQGRVQQWIDPLVRAMCIDPPLDALERSTKKSKMGNFYKKILSVILSEIEDNIDMTGCREYLDESVRS